VTLPPVSEPVTKKRRNLVPVAVLVGTLVVGALWVVGPYVFAGRDDPTTIDSRAVHDTAASACRELRTRVAGANGAEAENQAVEAMVARIRALGPAVLGKDVPTEQWLSDWERLVTARRQALAAGTSFTVPRVDGEPVNLRMFDLVKSSLRVCDVPAQLLRLPG
jgi:hypothetical protein